MDLARADRIDDDSMSPHEVENRDVRAGFLGKADEIELLQVVDALDDLGGIIDICRRTELAGEVGNAVTGDRISDRMEGLGDGHGKKDEG